MSDPYEVVKKINQKIPISFGRDPKAEGLVHHKGESGQAYHIVRSLPKIKLAWIRVPRQSDQLEKPLRGLGEGVSIAVGRGEGTLRDI